MNNNEQVADLLETTADRYESGVYEWLQGNLEDELGGYCSVGALSCTKLGKANYGVVDEAAHEILKHVKVQLDEDALLLLALTPEQFIKEHPETLLIAWNDDRNRTKDEVIQAMKMAAKDLRNSDGPATS